MDAIREVSANLTNARGASDDPYAAYISWANNSAAKLSRFVTASEVNRLVLTRRYWLLQSVPATPEPRT